MALKRLTDFTHDELLDALRLSILQACSCNESIPADKVLYDPSTGEMQVVKMSMLGLPVK